MIPETQVSDKRKAFLNTLFTQLSSVSYAVLKYSFAHPADLPVETDLDIVLPKSQLSNFLIICSQCSEGHHIILERKQGVSFVEIFFEDSSYLQIDLLHEIRVKGWQYMDLDLILEGAWIDPTGVRVADMFHSFIHQLFFYLLNQYLPPAKCYETWKRFSPQDKHQLKNYLLDFYGYQLSSEEETLFPQLSSQHHKLLKKRFKNYVYRRVVRRIMQLRDKVKYLPPVISFSGVDGAGKSTSIEHFRAKLETIYRRKVKLLRHRPGLFPILSSIMYGKAEAEAKATHNLPRQGTNYAYLSSLLRLFYYVLDYLVGYPLRVLPYRLKGYTILFDRYYFDFIADPRRSNIQLPPALLSSLYRLIHKPDLNFLLHADPAIIFQRKQELQVSTIQELTDTYLNTFYALGRGYKQQYISVENLQLNTTLSFLETSYCEILKQQHGTINH